MGSNNGTVQHNFSDSIGGDFESNRLCCNHAGDRDEEELSNSLEFVYKQKAQELVKKVIVDAKKMVTSCYTNVCIDNSSRALNGFELETTGSESLPSVLLTVMEKKDDLTDADMQSCKDCDTSSSVNNGLMTHADNINASNIEPSCIAEKRGPVLRPKDSSAGMQALLEKQLGVLRRVEACCKLGEDLLSMLLAETDCDFVIEVNGTKIRAHR
ncbi:hypothetical protein DPMN_156378 [Dreissena polymorpha]|uniref:Uncharacterized protein n=3 Tax=Dreissena polymorpha TaxID=45954 RepID=A0A9D4JAT2_DREPO|nr:hypothetical protein DPMN_156378 [Dreissena polymorpha]